MYEFFEIALKEKGLTVADVCRATGIRQSTLSNWKKRRNRISFDNGKKIAEFLGITTEFLYGGSFPQADIVAELPSEDSVVQVTTKHLNREYATFEVTHLSKDQRKRLEAYYMKLIEMMKEEKAMGINNDD